MVHVEPDRISLNEFAGYMPYHVGKKEFAAIVEQALNELPDEFAKVLEESTLEIRNRPTRRQLEDAGLEEDELLLGLYVGRPLTERSVESSGVMPDMIFIFQEDVELVSDTKDDLLREVRTTVLHEIGHFFGMSEDDLDKLGYG